MLSVWRQNCKICFFFRIIGTLRNIKYPKNNILLLNSRFLSLLSAWNEQWTTYKNPSNWECTNTLDSCFWSTVPSTFWCLSSQIETSRPFSFGSKARVRANRRNNANTARCSRSPSRCKSCLALIRSLAPFWRKDDWVGFENCQNIIMFKLNARTVYNIGNGKQEKSSYGWMLSV